MSKVNLLSGATMHTAGIFSDMTVDGPEIGTLVVIVDRAKNLPNRKTIGKQDPYCAARLGKEAKKTETDRRGGQTPRWDQEMRFTVHDSPDYYQLKVSVFNDDRKKTEVIGETYINLAEVVVPGGGKNDLWHNLTFKGKYAGEIRIEITYYDTRPKSARVLEKKKQAAASNEVQEAGRDQMGGPRQMKPVKRRPLPNNPTTGSPARGKATIIEQAQMPARERLVPAQEPAFDQPPSHLPPRARPLPPPESSSEYSIPARDRQSQQAYQTNQSPLQQLEYNTAPSRHPQSSSSNRHSSYDTNDYYSSHGSLSIAPAAAPLPPSERYEIYDPAPPGSEYVPGNILGRHNTAMEERDMSPHMTYDTRSDQGHYAPHTPDDYNPPSDPTGPPPPPPPHRGSNRASPSIIPLSANEVLDVPDFANINNPYDPSRNPNSPSVQPYAQRKSYQAYNPSRDQYRPPSRDQRPPSRDQRPPSKDYRPQLQDQQPPFRHHSFEDRGEQHRPLSRGQFDNALRHHSYDDRPRGGFESKQPTVEDAPPSPGLGAITHYRSGTFPDGRYEHVSSPAPLSLNGRGSAASGRQSASTHSSFQMSNGYPTSGSPASFTERTQNGSMSSHHSAPRVDQQYQQPPRRQDSDFRVGASPGGRNRASMPSALVAGMDPAIAQEISDRIYNDRRDNRGSFSNVGSFPRSGYRPDPVLAPYQQPRPTSSHGRQDNMSVFVPASAPNSYSQQSMVLANGTVRGRSPAPMDSQRNPRMAMRHSVSPVPSMRGHSRSPAPPQRRLSAVPFGPDDYEVLNPNVSKSGVQFTSTITPERKNNSTEKIVTHDGREIDPTDYLPVETYAAEYEKKVAPPKPPLQTAASLALARPRSQGRPYSMAATSNSPVYMVTPNKNPPPGRTRLQKKTARNHGPPPNHVGPLAPINPYQDNTNNFNPQALVRRSTHEYDSSENYAPSNALTHYRSHGQQQQQHHSYGDSNPDRGRGTSAPPIAAKIPMGGNGSGGGVPRQYVNHEHTAWSLLDEMKSIDLGAGSSRSRTGKKGW